jgi:hypothetical protein
LESLLARKAELFIGYGICEDPDDDPKAGKDEYTQQFFRDMQRKYPNQFFLVRLGDTHAKILIKDYDFLVIGSFNWMSFSGRDHGDRFREEISYLITERAQIEEGFEHYLNRFSTFYPQLAGRMRTEPQQYKVT